MEKEIILEILQTVVHPDSGVDIVTSEIVESVATDNSGAVSVVLNFPKARDPFANSVKRQIIDVLTVAHPDMEGRVSVMVKEAAPKKVEKQADKQSYTDKIGKIIAVASGKGGVGKSTVTANLAVALAGLGYRVGVLDADIYGPSMPQMFGVMGYVPQGGEQGEQQYISPAVAHGVKIMSIGFFIKPDDALVWRGPMATNALKQLIHQTQWGELDYLLVDLPPGTGDVHLSVVGELRVDGAVIVSTPQGVALADVLRGVRMFQAEGIGIPVLGIIENMAWFTPAELPDNRYYIFGKGGAQKLAQSLEIDLLGETPIVMSIMEGGDAGHPASIDNSEVGKAYRSVAEKIISKLKS